MNDPDNITLKKSFSTGKLLSSRLLLKAGSVFFLIFFIAFMLSVPMAAQFGSFFFILFGALVFANNPEDKSVPPVPDQAIYSSVNSITAADNGFVQQQVLQYSPEIPAANLQAAEKILSEEHILIYNRELTAGYEHVLSNLVRAGPRTVVMYQVG